MTAQHVDTRIEWCSAQSDAKEERSRKPANKQQIVSGRPVLNILDAHSRYFGAGERCFVGRTRHMAGGIVFKSPLFVSAERDKQRVWKNQILCASKTEKRNVHCMHAKINLDIYCLQRKYVAKYRDVEEITAGNFALWQIAGPPL